jgi:dTDP-4-dehydrorhamnose reductase
MTIDNLQSTILPAEVSTKAGGNGQPDKVAILGGKGMLGSDIAEECGRRRIPFEVFDLPEFDITNDSQLFGVVKKHRTIINCAAYTNVDKAETETEKAMQVNTEAVGKLGLFALKTGAWVLHISTDFVFDGAGDKPLTEKDLPRPINAYGRTKFAGERLLVENKCKYCIIRVEWTYGLHGDNFIKKILQRAKSQSELKVVNDQFGTPTATTEAAMAICDVMKKKPTGIFHFASQGYASRFEVSQFIVKQLGLAVQVIPCKTSDFPSPAARPLNSRLDCTKIRKFLHVLIKPWHIPLGEFLKRL